jgi:hypothetical protein
MNLSPEALSLIMGAFLPPIIDLINTKIVNSKIRYLVSIIVCILIATSIQLLSIGFNWKELIESASIVFLSAQSIYRLYWKDSSLRNN